MDLNGGLSPFADIWRQVSFSLFLPYRSTTLWTAPPMKTRTMQKQAQALLDQDIKAMQRVRKMMFGRTMCGGLIEAERAAVGISMAELTRRMKIKVQTYQRLRKRLIEKGEVIKISTLSKAANALGCDLVVLLVPREAASFAALASLEARKAADEKKQHARTLKDAEATLRRDTKMKVRPSSLTAPARWKEYRRTPPPN